jgi:hypothetical protein
VRKAPIYFSWCHEDGGSNRRLILVSKKRAFISFDYHHDERIKLYLAGQAKNPDSPFEFKDNSVRDHLPGDWRQKVRRRMDNIDVVIVLCGEHTHTANGVSEELAIAKDLNKPYFLLAGYPNGKCTKPASASPSDNVYRWTWDNLKLLLAGKR